MLQKKARERRSQRLFVIEGLRAALEVPSHLLKAVYVIAGFNDTDGGKAFLKELSAKNPSVPIEEVSEKVFASMCDTITPQGVLAVAAMEDFTLEDCLGKKDGKVPHLILLESLQDPGNLGTIVRTAEGAGATGIIMNKTTVDIYSPKVVRSTMGSLFRVPHLIVDDFEATINTLKQAHGIMLYAAHLKGKLSYDGFDYTKPCGFLIGNEGNGLTKETADLASDYLKIPMEGKLESLNASVAASILMYEVHRQRSK